MIVIPRRGGVPSWVRRDLISHSALAMTARSGMVASVLMAAMPPVSCLSYRHDHREDEDGAPGADQRDGDQCVDGHSEPYSSRRYRAAAGALRAVISKCLPSSSLMTANGSVQSLTSHLALRSAGITAGSRVESWGATDPRP